MQAVAASTPPWLAWADVPSPRIRWWETFPQKKCWRRCEPATYHYLRSSRWTIYLKYRQNSAPDTPFPQRRIEGKLSLFRGSHFKMTYENIELGYHARIATITLNRPDKRNAISFDLIDDLRHALDEVEKSSALV